MLLPQEYQMVHLKHRSQKIRYIINYIPNYITNYIIQHDRKKR